jgi:uncharacterized membrane protein
MTMPKPNAKPVSKTRRKSRVVRHKAFFIAAPLGLAAFAAAVWFTPKFAIGIGANVMFASYLIMIFFTMHLLTPEFLRKRADEADTPVAIILLVVGAVVGVSFYALFNALNSKAGPEVGQVILSVVSVLLGWFVIHTMAALHYAYEFYESATASPGKGKAGAIVGGLDFPEGDAPDGIAFLYFAYVLGTAFAVSDIRVTSNKMRKIIMVHSTFSYFFNTLIVAATVNVAVAVGGS